MVNNPTKKYNCVLCNESFTRPSHLMNHNKTLKHIQNIENNKNNEMYQIITKLQKQVSDLEIEKTETKHALDNLQKEFLLLKVRFTDNTDKNKDKKFYNVNNSNNSNNVNLITDNRITHITTNININLRAHGNENWNYFGKNEIVDTMKAVNSCLPEIVRKLHFNDEHPENHNIRIPNRKQPDIKVYNGTDWLTKSKSSIIDSMIHNILEKLTDEYEEDFYTNATLFIQNLWKTKYDQITNSLNKENKLAVKELRKQIEYCILDNQ